MKKLIVFILFLAISGGLAFFYFLNVGNNAKLVDYSALDTGDVFLSPQNVLPSIIPKPDEVKAIHLAYGSYLSSTFTDILSEIMNSQINAIIFEIKDPTGYVALNNDSHVKALEELIPKLNHAGIYTIARMVVFQDTQLVASNPELAIKNSATQEPWQDYKGVHWSDPTSPDVWEYNLDIAQRAADIGFDEINYDYIRFPSDGPVRLAQYSNLVDENAKGDVIADFLKFTHENLYSHVFLSVDVFGMAFINDQEGIGQYIEKMAPYVDIIMPMSYPSHYPDGFRGLDNPSEHPHLVVLRTLEKGFEKLEGYNVIVRPWIQDFNLGAIYDDHKIQEQIRAGKDLGIETWALWNASNRYRWSAVK